MKTDHFLFIKKLKKTLKTRENMRKIGKHGKNTGKLGETLGKPGGKHWEK